MELLFICIIIFALIMLLKIKKEDNSDEVKCLVCDEPLISSNYDICYKCRIKQTKKEES